ncbi:unnamed protein product, partial [Mesorhabditis spiculigera]
MSAPAANDRDPFECPLCEISYAEWRQPLCISCGHTVCTLCTAEGRASTCPICSAPITSSFINFALIEAHRAYKNILEAKALQDFEMRSIREELVELKVAVEVDKKINLSDTEKCPRNGAQSGNGQAEEPMAQENQMRIEAPVPPMESPIFPEPRGVNTEGNTTQLRISPVNERRTPNYGLEVAYRTPGNSPGYERNNDTSDMENYRNSVAYRTPATESYAPVRPQTRQEVYGNQRHQDAYRNQCGANYGNGFVGRISPNEPLYGPIRNDGYRTEAPYGTAYINPSPRSYEANRNDGYRTKVSYGTGRAAQLNYEPIHNDAFREEVPYGRGPPPAYESIRNDGHRPEVPYGTGRAEGLGYGYATRRHDDYSTHAYYGHEHINPVERSRSTSGSGSSRSPEKRTTAVILAPEKKIVPTFEKVPLCHRKEAAKYKSAPANGLPKIESSAGFALNGFRNKVKGRTHERQFASPFAQPGMEKTDKLLLRGIPLGVTEAQLCRELFGCKALKSIRVRASREKQNCIAEFQLGEAAVKQVIAAWDKKRFPGTSHVLTADFLWEKTKDAVEREGVTNEIDVIVEDVNEEKTSTTTETDSGLDSA